MLSVGSNHADVAVISQEHPSWGDKQLFLDWNKSHGERKRWFGGYSSSSQLGLWVGVNSKQTEKGSESFRECLGQVM